VLNGTTGFGAAKLISDAKLGRSELDYSFTVEADAANVQAALINGDADIAALPTNAAAALYARTDGEIMIAAVNTLGVLYLMSSGEKIDSMDELRGKTVYCPAQNPAFIFEAVCHGAGLTVGKDVFIDTAYAQPADLRAALISGKVDIAVLPEPMVTIAQSANENLTVALDLTREWEKIYGDSSLMQGCVVVRREFAEKYPEKLERFLLEYKSSIDFTNEYPADAAALIVSEQIFAGKAEIAQAAIPKCNIKYIDGEEMSVCLDAFFEALYSVAPQSVGGRIPDADIYYVKPN
jgi:NitT/TauT family transport system substrate-binding protein